MKKVIVAQLSIKKEKLADFLSLADIMVENTNNEPGCICYKLMQGVKDDGDFIFYEEYNNQEAIAFHNASEHFKTFGEAIANMLVKAPLVDVY